MASYTMELKTYIEMWSQNETLSTKDKIEKGRVKLFDFEYPIFDPLYKKVFETHFIRKFYMREIGFETEGRFKFELENWLIINMGYFNKLFESELLDFDPLTNTKVNIVDKKTIDRDQIVDSTTDGTNVGHSTSDTDGTLTENNFDRRLESNNPDSRLAITPNADGTGVIEYANNIKEDKETNSKTSSSLTTNDNNDTTTVKGKTTGSINEIEDYIHSKTGKVGDQSYSKMLTEYRDSLIRIENKIFNEMQELFMLVY